MLNELNISLITSAIQKAFRHITEMYADEALLFNKEFIKDKVVAEEIVSIVFVKIWNYRLEVDQMKRTYKFHHTQDNDYKRVTHVPF